MHRTIQSTSLLVLLLACGCGLNVETPLGGGGTMAATPTAGNQPSGGVAVIDLDEVARRVERDVRINQEIKDHESKLNDQLASLKASYASQYEAKKRTFGDDPTDEQRQQLASIQQSINTQLQQARQNAENDLAAFRRDAVNRFREEVKPLASRVAASRGMSVVVTRNESVLFTFDPAAEITDAVIEAMKDPQTAAPRSTVEVPKITRQPADDGMQR